MKFLRGRRRRSLTVILLAALAIAVTWPRDPPEHGGDSGTLQAVELDVPAPPTWPGSLELLGVWELTGANRRFGSYSALVPLPDERLRAFSDRGAYLDFSTPPSTRQEAVFGAVQGLYENRTWYNDIESAQRDPATGQVWLGNEFGNVVRRFEADGRSVILAQPAAMRDWLENGGAEAMVRLADGRFVILAEKSRADRFEKPGPGLLFAGDPVDGAEAVEFRFETADGYQPTDMALLPDGRVLILLRSLAFGFPPFRGILAIADPATIRAGEPWPWTMLAELENPLPRENYEGMAVVLHSDGSSTIWLISDDNRAQWQRTLLVGLRLRHSENG